MLWRPNYQEIFDIFLKNFNIFHEILIAMDNFSGTFRILCCIKSSNCKLKQSSATGLRQDSARQPIAQCNYINLRLRNRVQLFQSLTAAQRCIRICRLCNAGKGFVRPWADDFLEPFQVSVGQFTQKQRAHNMLS